MIHRSLLRPDFVLHMHSYMQLRIFERTRADPVRWITQLEQAGITTTPQFLSLGDTGAEVRTALADLLDWPSSTAANIPKLAKGVAPRGGIASQQHDCGIGCSFRSLTVWHCQFS